MKTFILVISLLACSSSSFADQLAYITKEQAEMTVAYFTDKGIEEVALWCACCDKDLKVKVAVVNVYYKYTGYEKYYQVYITGTTLKGKFIDEGVDLAYVHVRKGKRWYCLGKELGFECDPCTKPFKL